jgi:hypothetical protein
MSPDRAGTAAPAQAICVAIVIEEIFAQFV